MIRQVRIPLHQRGLRLLAGNLVRALIVVPSCRCRSRRPGAGVTGPKEKLPARCCCTTRTWSHLAGGATNPTSIGIGGGRILFVDNRSHRRTHCQRTIDLGGRTVVPGLIDTHIHFLRDGACPGYDIRRIEVAGSIAEVQALIAEASKVAPQGSFIAAKGGFNHRQFAEKRMPTREELDAATTDFPVYLQEGFRGRATANSAAIEYFRAHGVSVSDEGVVTSSDFTAAERAMRATQTEHDRLRETGRLMQQAVEWGLTTVVDQGDAPAGYNPDSHYDSIVSLWRKDRMPVRVRLSLLSYDVEAAGLLEERLRNNFMGFGDDLLAVSGVGEHIIRYRGLFSDPPPRELFVGKLMAIAEKGWAFTQHSSSLAQDRGHIRAMGEIDRQIPISELRWSLAHVSSIGEAELAELRRPRRWRDPSNSLVPGGTRPWRGTAVPENTGCGRSGPAEAPTRATCHR